MFNMKTLSMKFDTSYHPGFFAVLLLPVIFIVVRIFNDSLFDALQVNVIESAEAVWLLFCCLFTLAYMKPWQRLNSKRMFWLWAAQWWLMLFGRSISWGRDIFSHHPHWIFRTLSVVWIAPLIIMLLSKDLRDELKQKLHTEAFPVLYFALALVCFLISDTVEHKRALYFIFVANKHYQDITEELYELPFMLALFQTAWHFMKADKKTLKIEGYKICASEEVTE